MSQPPDARPYPKADRPRILVVDDDQLIRRLVVKSLEADFAILEADSGTAGLSLARNQPPDLILLDLMMPGMDGYAVCQAFRQSSATASIPILMLTALDQVDSKVKGLRTGADDYITKPFDLQELRTRVEAHLRRSERDRSASPLTGLPGNNAIEQILTARVESGDPLAVLYVDLTNFKAYNDAYGWLKGDQVLRLLAQTLVDVVSALGVDDDFVGHVGGDDFVVVSEPARAGRIAQEVITRFDAAIPVHYGEQARARGYDVARNRRGKPYRAPIVTLAVAIVTNVGRTISSAAEVASLAAQVKRYVKAKPGSHYAFDHRTK